MAGYGRTLHRLCPAVLPRALTRPTKLRRRQFLAEQPRLFARRLGGEAPQQHQQRAGVARFVLLAAGEHALDHAPLEPGGSAGLADEADFVHAIERRTERRIT